MGLASRGNVRVAKYLIDQGALVNVKNKNCETPLSTACRSRKVEMIKLLLAHHADMSVTDDRGKTVLENMVEWKLDDIANLLREAEGK
jgi:ankyrin repeat protein